MYLLAADVTLRPRSDVLPGGSVLEGWLGGLAWFALAACLVGLVLSAGLWAIGGYSANYTQSVSGKKGVMIALGAAIAIGGASQILDFFYGQGTQVKPADIGSSGFVDSNAPPAMNSGSGTQSVGDNPTGGPS